MCDEDKEAVMSVIPGKRKPKKARWVSVSSGEDGAADEDGGLEASPKDATLTSTGPELAGDAPGGGRRRVGRGGAGGGGA